MKTACKFPVSFRKIYHLFTSLFNICFMQDFYLYARSRSKEQKQIKTNSPAYKDRIFRFNSVWLISSADTIFQDPVSCTYPTTDIRRFSQVLFTAISTQPIGFLRGTEQAGCLDFTQVSLLCRATTPHLFRAIY